MWKRDASSKNNSTRSPEAEGFPSRQANAAWPWLGNGSAQRNVTDAADCQPGYTSSLRDLANTKLLAVSQRGTLLWTTQGTLYLENPVKPVFWLSRIDGTDPQPFPIALPGDNKGVRDAWPAGNDAWYLATHESDPQGALHLSLWYVESNGRAHRLACDPNGLMPDDRGMIAVASVASAGLAAEGVFYVSIRSYPGGRWGIARLDNPGSSADTQ